MSDRKLKYEVPDDCEYAVVRDIMKYKLCLSKREISHAKAFDDGIIVNGDKVTVRKDVRRGDVLEITLHENIESASKIVPINEPLDIIYEDDDFICINKPAGLVIHPSHGHFLDSVCNRLAWHYNEKGEKHVMRAVGRLDRETSGLILFGKNRAAAGILTKEGMDGTRSKEYLALCKGSFDNKKGEICSNIEDIPGVRMKRRTTDESSGEPSRTFYEVLEEFDGYCLVRLRLGSGRTHQIRVHMSSIGHPILGDSLYGDEACEKFGICRTALHSSKITMIKPFSGEKCDFIAPLPDDMRELVQLL